MRDGCAGFFSEDELSKGKGLIHSKDEIEERKKISEAINKKRKSFVPFLKCAKKKFDKQNLLNLTNGDTALCFGKNYETVKNHSLKFSSKKMLMIDRVTKVDLRGGIYGLGFIVAEKDLNPKDWYFPCHFKDDQVLAGSLMSEACVQLLQFYMLYLGFQTKTFDARFQPIFNLSQKVRCRGEVIPKDKRLRYEMEIKEINKAEKNFYVIADINVFLENKIVVDFKDLGVQLIEKHLIKPKPKPKQKFVFNKQHLEEFALGKLSRCFGEEFEIYDDRNMSPRTPNTYLQLIDRIVDIDGEKNNFKKKASLISEFDIKKDAWFLNDISNSVSIPYSILMEIALQPCGFLATYLGTTLLEKNSDLFFRNIDGSADIISVPDLAGKTISAKITLLSTSKSGKTIIQSFNCDLFADGKRFYIGTAVFGFFPKESLINQKGLDGGIDNHPVRHSSFLKKAINFKKQNLAHKLNFLDKILINKSGGKYKQGYVYAEKKVDKNDFGPLE